MIHVVAGVLIDTADRILIAQRPPGKHLAGGWEFPGGKLEAGEARVAALARELREELGVEIGPLPRPLLRLTHTYDYGQVLLDMFVVRDFTGEPRGLDAQALRWCTQVELDHVALLPADRPIVRALTLPERLEWPSDPHYRIVSAQRVGVDALADANASLLGAWCRSLGEAEAVAVRGAEFLVMRDALTASDLNELCRTVHVPVYAAGLSMPEAWKLGATGVSEISEIFPAIC